jgi:hypothetical protein
LNLLCAICQEYARSCAGGGHSYAKIMTVILIRIRGVGYRYIKAIGGTAASRFVADSDLKRGV